jgi:hypothetical protein
MVLVKEVLKISADQPFLSQDYMRSAEHKIPDPDGTSKGKEKQKRADIEVPSESFHRSSLDSRTCYPRRAFNQELTDDSPERITYAPLLTTSLSRSSPS